MCARSTNLIFSDSWPSLSACICDTLPLCVCTQCKGWRQRANGREWLPTAEHSVSATLRDRVTKPFLAGPAVSVDSAGWANSPPMLDLWHSYLLQRPNYDFLIRGGGETLLLPVAQVDKGKELILMFIKSTDNSRRCMKDKGMLPFFHSCSPEGESC